ncbi:hypothetical protein PGB90_003195 [Kerria lacca]
MTDFQEKSLRRIYKVVLTGAYKFQENLLKSMLQIENTFFELANSNTRDCLIICDRGVMDVSSFITPEKWEHILASNNLNIVELRDSRYNQIVHMVSAANGAEEFYTIEDHSCRSEGVEKAREIDNKNAGAWLGHPYFDVIDNTSDFETKIRRLIAVICQKVGVDPGDRLANNTKKRKWLVKAPLPPDSMFLPFQDFEVVHHYLQMKSKNFQARVRKRGQKGQYAYTHTIRKPKMHGQVIEVKTQLTQRDYLNMVTQRDEAHFPIFKKRRCFIYKNQYFQLDIYREPCHPRCKGIIIIETYTALEDNEIQAKLPPFLNINFEVTGNPDYSMFNLSLVEDWHTSDKYCNAFKGSGIETTLNDDIKLEELKQTVISTGRLNGTA